MRTRIAPGSQSSTRAGWDCRLEAGIGLVMVASVLFGGCGVTLHAGRPTTMPSAQFVVSEGRAARCVRSASGPGAAYREPVPGALEDADLLPYLSSFTADARRTAVAAGVEPLLARTIREHTRAHGRPTLDLLEMRQELSDRLSSLPGQLLASASECECIINAIDEVLAADERAEHDRELYLTVATLIAGPGFGVASGIWEITNQHTMSPAVPEGPFALAVLGAVVELALGTAILISVPNEIVSMHEHNLLAPVWTGNDETLLYPTFVFRLLTLPVHGGAATPRDELLVGWRAHWEGAVDDSERATAETIMYGAGGTYDPDLLSVRRALYEDLRAKLWSFGQRVDELNEAIADAMEAELTRPTDDATPPP